MLDKTKPKLVLKTEWKLSCVVVFFGAAKNQINTCAGQFAKVPVLQLVVRSQTAQSKAKTDQKVALLIAVFKSDLPQFSATFLQRERPY
jgi:hypothetical protein